MMESAQSSVSVIDPIDSLSRAAALACWGRQGDSHGFAFGLLQKQRNYLDNG